jgi:uncharacterized membrane protein YsdA (DUF1294 family)
MPTDPIILAIGAYLLVINAVTFVFFGFDKWLATSNSWRVRERSLFILMLLGGSVGALLSMRMFRHKTRKTDFQLIAAAIIVVQLAAIFLGYYLYKK